MTKRRRKAQTVGDLVARGITPSDVPPVTALIGTRHDGGVVRDDVSAGAIPAGAGARRRQARGGLSEGRVRRTERVRV